MATPVKSKRAIMRLLHTHRARIAALGARRIGLFGSFVRGEARRHSDVDILVEFEPRQKTLDNFLALASFLEEILRRRVELVTPESLSPFLRPRILQEVEYVSLAA
ncbi:MAG TPA: nucleotidyltransferase family protein [Planctomycetota bacterium]|nr:nucleotidyltransferase family protein [Planctomycetota bacterium]HRR79656.1 nucleotidyltransferase family protein [Planctomycetota bacterium]HRT93664.1 nucleotidyltransferase family protein [Planctomycetota bacterium]